MKILPRSLLGKTILLMIGLLVTTQLITSLLFHYYYVDPYIQQRMQLVGTNLKTIAQAIQELPPDQRDAYLATLSAKDNILLARTAETKESKKKPHQHDHPVPPPPPAGKKPPPIAEKFAAFLPNFGGKAPEIRQQTQGKNVLWINLGLKNQDYWVGIPTAELRPAFSKQWLIWLSISALILLLWFIWLMTRVNRPLSRLTESAREIGAGNIPEKLAESGNSEIAELNRTFNQMAVDLKEITEKRTLLLAGISHDLRTPLARLRLGLEMLTNQNNAVQIASLFQDIEAMDKIIGQFLEFVRSGNEESPTTTDINQLLAEVKQQFNTQHHQITMHCQPLPTIKTKPITLKRLLTNLINNALVHAQTDVDVYSQSNHGKLVIIVADRGPGIPAAELEHLLQPFTRLEQSVTNTTGLGLAICQRMAKAINADLTFHARDGGGLAVEVTLSLESPNTEITKK